MDFNNFGVISFTGAAKISPFVDHLFQGRFMTTKCTHCNRPFFPPQADCPHCLSDDMEWIEIKDAGTLVSYSTAMFGPAGFEKKVPYTLGIGRFREGIQILAAVADEIDSQNLKIGLKVKVKPVKLNEERVSYEFVLDQ